MEGLLQALLRSLDINAKLLPCPDEGLRLQAGLHEALVEVLLALNGLQALLSESDGRFELAFGHGSPSLFHHFPGLLGIYPHLLRMTGGRKGLA